MFEVVLIFWVCCGIGAAIIANARGANGCGWAIAGFFLGPLGLLLAALITGHQCPQCRKTISGEAKICPYCRSDLRSSAPPQSTPPAEPGAEQHVAPEVPAGPPPEAANPKSGDGVALIIALIAVAACGLLIYFTTGTTGSAREGSVISFSGVARSSAASTFTGTPYFMVEGGGLTAKCYFQGRPPVAGTWVTVRGTVTVWVDGSGGSLRPCVVRD